MFEIHAIFQKENGFENMKLFSLYIENMRPVRFCGTNYGTWVDLVKLSSIIKLDYLVAAKARFKTIARAGNFDVKYSPGCIISELSLQKFLGRGLPGPSPNPSPVFVSGFALDSGFSLNFRALRALDSGFVINFRAVRTLHSAIQAFGLRPQFSCCPGMARSLHSLPKKCRQAVFLT